jgi:hypothetical protein
MQRARKTFFAPGRRIGKGELFADSDPILKGRAALFEHVDVPTVPEQPEPESKPARKTATKKVARGSADAG